MYLEGRNIVSISRSHSTKSLPLFSTELIQKARQNFKTGCF
jgi:hypothetical protein